MWRWGSLGAVIGELWDFTPLVCIMELIDCYIVFYVVVLCCMDKRLKWLIISVNNLLVTF